MDKKLRVMLRQSMAHLLPFLTLESFQGVSYITSTDTASLDDVCPHCGPANAVTRHRIDPSQEINKCNLVTFCCDCNSVIAWLDYRGRKTVVLYPITINVDKP